MPSFSLRLHKSKKNDNNIAPPPAPSSPTSHPPPSPPAKDLTTIHLIQHEVTRLRATRHTLERLEAKLATAAQARTHPLSTETGLLRALNAGAPVRIDTTLRFLARDCG